MNRDPVCDRHGLPALLPDPYCRQCLTEIPYRDYLQTDAWQVKAAEARERAGHQCAVCTSPYDLHVHHRTYDRRGREEPDDLTVLCAKHHATIHGKEYHAPPPLTRAKRREHQALLQRLDTVRDVDLPLAIEEQWRKVREAERRARRADEDYRS